MGTYLSVWMRCQDVVPILYCFSNGLIIGYDPYSTHTRDNMFEDVAAEELWLDTLTSINNLKNCQTIDCSAGWNTSKIWNRKTSISMDFDIQYGGLHLFDWLLNNSHVIYFKFYGWFFHVIYLFLVNNGSGVAIDCHRASTRCRITNVWIRETRKRTCFHQENICRCLNYSATHLLFTNLHWEYLYSKNHRNGRIVSKTFQPDQKRVDRRTNQQHSRSFCSIWSRQNWKNGNKKLEGEMDNFEPDWSDDN